MEMKVIVIKDGKMRRLTLRVHGTVTGIFSVAFIVLLWGGMLLASGEYEIVTEWGGTGSEDGKFKEPVSRRHRQQSASDSGLVVF